MQQIVKNKQYNIRILLKYLIIFSILTTLTACNEIGKNVIEQSTHQTQANNSISYTTTTLAANTATQNNHNLHNHSKSSAEDSTYAPITEYAYAANGTKIEMFHIESTGGLTSIGSIVAPSGLSSGAQISSIAISPSHTNVYATIKNGSSGDKIWMLTLNAANGMLQSMATPYVNTTKSNTSSLVVSASGLLVYVTDSMQICTYKVRDSYGSLPSLPTW